MVFSSNVFLLVFLPLTILLNYLMPSVKLKNASLLIASLIFYAYGEPIYILLMLFSAFVNWFLARWMAKNHEKSRSVKTLIVLAVVFNIGLLLLFKYTNLFVDTLNQLLSLNISNPQIRLPIGISFFTFQILSYVLDVALKKIPAERSFAVTLLYITFFPQLIAGPIVQFKDIAREIHERHVSLDDMVYVLQRFAFGLGKKVLLANVVAKAADTIFNNQAAMRNAPLAWLGAFAYCLQIYYDFSAYSDMAIGMGRIFGFRFHENFNYPYYATSLRDFWKRWHISLTSWFREYVYIPLGGNRKGIGRTVFNRFFVFLLTGFWHGANWTFLFWGVYHGIFQIIESFWKRDISDAQKNSASLFKGRLARILKSGLARIYTLFVVLIGFVIFRSDSLSHAFDFIERMFSSSAYTLEQSFLMADLWTPLFVFVFVVALLFTQPIFPSLKKRILEQPSQPSRKILAFTMAAAALIVLVLSMLELSVGSYNPFIYFRF